MLQVRFNNCPGKFSSGEAEESQEVKLDYESNNLYHVYLEGIVSGCDRRYLMMVVDISQSNTACNNSLPACVLKALLFDDFNLPTAESLIGSHMPNLQGSSP